MVNYECAFSQSEKEKYFEWTINLFNTLKSGCLNFYLSTCKVISVNKRINKPTFVLYKLALFLQWVSQTISRTYNKLHQNFILTAELNKVELALEDQSFKMSFISIGKGLYIYQIFVFHFPNKVVPQCLLKPTPDTPQLRQPLSSDNNLVRQSQFVTIAYL